MLLHYAEDAGEEAASRSFQSIGLLCSTSSEESLHLSCHSPSALSLRPDMLDIQPDMPYDVLSQKLSGSCAEVRPGLRLT